MSQATQVQGSERTGFPFVDTQLARENATFSWDAPFWTMLPTTENIGILKAFFGHRQSEEAFKLQNIVLYGGLRLSQILMYAKEYTQIADPFESERRMHWIESGLLQEFRYFAGYIGIAAAMRITNGFDIPPIYTFLSKEFGSVTELDLPVSLDLSILERPLFGAWCLKNVSWSMAWWLDPDFNMDWNDDPRNKTRIMTDLHLMHAIKVHWNSLHALKLAEHTAVTEGSLPHTSRRSQWKQTSAMSDVATPENSEWATWQDLYVDIHGRRWAPADPEEDPYPGVDLLGFADAHGELDSECPRREDVDPTDMVANTRRYLVKKGIEAQQTRQPQEDEPLFPDEDRRNQRHRKVSDKPFSGRSSESVRGTSKSPSHKLDTSGAQRQKGSPKTQYVSSSDDAGPPQTSPRPLRKRKPHQTFKDLVQQQNVRTLPPTSDAPDSDSAGSVMPDWTQTVQYPEDRLPNTPPPGESSDTSKSSGARMEDSDGLSDALLNFADQEDDDVDMHGIEGDKGAAAESDEDFEAALEMFGEADNGETAAA